MVPYRNMQVQVYHKVACLSSRQRQHVQRSSITPSLCTILQVYKAVGFDHPALLPVNSTITHVLDLLCPLYSLAVEHCRLYYDGQALDPQHRISRLYLQMFDQVISIADIGRSPDGACFRLLATVKLTQFCHVCFRDQAV